MEFKDLDTKLKLDDKNTFNWSLRELIARRVSSIIWGQGYVFQSEKPEIEKSFNKFAKMNKLPMFISFVEKQCSKYGRCIITMNKTKTGEIMLNLCDPFYFNGIGKVFVQEQLAVIWQRFEVDTKFYVVKSTYDTKSVTNEVFSGEEDKVQVLDKQAEILERLQMPKKWNHGLDFVPVVEIINLPLFQFQWNNMEYVKVTDWYPAWRFEGTIYKTLQNLEKELFYCHSRVIVDNASQDYINRLKASRQAGEDTNIDDFVIQSDTGAEVKIQAGNGDFTKYTNTVDSLMDIYFKFCGQSRFSEGGGAQKTVAETVNTRSGLIETITSKIKLREQQYTELFWKIMCAYGHGSYWEDEPKFKFEINGNLLKDDGTYIDNLEKQINMGLMSTVEAIQEKFGLSQTDADKKFHEIQAFNEKYMNQLQEDESESGGEKGINSLGQHKTETGGKKGWDGND